MLRIGPTELRDNYGDELDNEFDGDAGNSRYLLYIALSYSEPVMPFKNIGCFQSHSHCTPILLSQLTKTRNCNPSLTIRSHLPGQEHHWRAEAIVN